MNPGTFSKIYLHIIFGVKWRKCLIKPDWESEIFKYISAFLKNNDLQLIQINGMPDHIHILIRIRPSTNISDLIREVKKSSNKFINSRFMLESKFEWQGGYGVFSVSESSLDIVRRYIQNQKTHHKDRKFKEEYKLLLDKHKVDYKEEFLFDFLDEE
jgi:REP element-mobilizing transposase RayT